MTPFANYTSTAWAARLAGAGLAAAILALQGMAVSRIAGAYHTKRAEPQLEQLAQQDTPLDTVASSLAELNKVIGARKGLIAQVEGELQRALAVDSTNGMACWFLSKACLTDAQMAGDLGLIYRREGARAKQTGNASLAAQYAAAEKIQTGKRDELLANAEELAARGRYSFNSVGGYKQRASIHLRRGQPDRAEPYLQTVARIKPDDIEAIERLGLIKLTLRKWDDLGPLCDQILQKHPYSANAYYYKAYMAQEKINEKQGSPESNRQDLYLNVRQAYLMWRQKTGEIFFNPRNLEQMAVSLGLAETKR